MRNDIEYEKGRKIAEEITALMKSEQESEQIDSLSDEFQEWVLSDETAMNVIKKLSNQEQLEAACSEFNSKEQQNDIHHLVYAIQAKEKIKRRIRFVKVFATAAAAILCVSFFVQTLFFEENAKKELLSNVELNNTIFKPTLILANGDNIDLTSGETELNNGIVEKSGENKLVYKNSLISENTNNTVKEEVKEEIKYNTLVIPKLFLYNLELSDGTTVCLNANSELKYPILFNQDTREVYLKGEAYFNVKKGEKPFIIKVGEVEVKVYGTQFNINAYDKSSIKTVLIEGSVGVSVKGEQTQEVMIKPNQMVEVQENGRVVVTQVDVQHYTSWMNGDITSLNAPLVDLLNKISCWYGVEFRYSDAIKEIKISTSLKNTLPLEKILTAIEKITNLKLLKTGENNYMIE